jgi:adenylate cyclase
VAPEGVERKLAAILSADVAGYSRLMAEDEAGTVRRLTDYREAIAMLVRQHRGCVVDSPGDNVLAEFPAATDAVSCAVEIQGVLNARNAPLPEDRKMEFRLGVNLGEVRVEGERIYGDGVNIAARLEGLAKPAGICISGEVHSQVERKLELGFEDLGEQQVKNIPRPIRVYRVAAESARATSDPSLPGMEDRTVPGFHGAPAIAVLAFDNLSGDPEQEYFADGIAEDLITRLSAFGSFPVIARNSSFVYKGKSVDVKQAGTELGAGYVVEGSVRKAGNRVRISAQLIDARTGAHVWAEQYDRELEDIFELQDEITEAITGSMGSKLMQHEGERSVQSPPRDLKAWDLVQRAGWHLGRLTREDVATACSLFQRAVDLDPNFALPYAGIGWTQWVTFIEGWTTEPERSLQLLRQAAEKGAALDPDSPITACALGFASLGTGRQEAAIAAFERAVEHAPSFALANASLGWALLMVGRPEEAIVRIEKAMRLNPRDTQMYLSFYYMGAAHFVASSYEDAVIWMKRVIGVRPDWSWAYLFLTASYAHVARSSQARDALGELLRLWPGFGLSTPKALLPGADPSWVERLIDGLRKAGLEE